MSLDILNKFTANLKNSLGRAINISWKFKHPQVTTIHLYVGIAQQKGSIAAEIIKKTKVPPEAYQKYLSALNSVGSTPFPQLSPQATQIIEKAALLAFNNQHIYIGTEHLLLAILQNPDEQLQKIWLEYKIQTPPLIKQLTNILKNNSRFSDITALFNDEEQCEEDPEAISPFKKESSALNFFCTN